MRSLCVAAALALACANTLAADFGIGISARSDDGFLYAPIDVSKSFRIEPFARYGSSEQTIKQGTLENTQETDTLELGVGLFGITRITEAAHIYYGGRLAYVDTQSNTVDQGSFGQVIESESNQDGYRIGPTLGFEYLFGGHFSVGGEASYNFIELEGDSSARIRGSFSQPSRVDIEQSGQSTQTRLIFRYMF